MDLHKAWKELQKEKFSHSKFDKDMILQAIQKDSNSAMSQLKKNLFIKIMWVSLFTTLAIISMIFNYDCTDFLLIMSLPLLYFGISLIIIYQQYRKLDATMDFSAQPLALMKRYHETVKSALKFETVSGLIFFPIAAISGFCLGEHSNGVSLVEIFQDADTLFKMLIAIVILTPIAYYGGKGMNRKAFGGLQQQLKENIERMEELK